MALQVQIIENKQLYINKPVQQHRSESEKHTSENLRQFQSECRKYDLTNVAKTVKHRK